MFAALLLLMVAAQQSPPPGSTLPELPGGLFRQDGLEDVDYLQVSETLLLTYAWHDESQYVEFTIKHRALPTDPWQFLYHRELVPYRMTAVAPRYHDTLYVAGVNLAGKAIIDRWILSVSAGALTLTKTILYQGFDLTHIEALAASPDNNYLLAKHYETDELYRLDLPSMARTTLLTVQEVPALTLCDTVEYQRHPVQGHAFLCISGIRGGYPSVAVDTRLLVWDYDLDGQVDLWEEVSSMDWQARGYYNAGWEPVATFLSLLPQAMN